MTDDFDNSQEPCTLEPLVKNGRTIGYTVHPDHRERWDAPPSRGPVKTKPAQKPRPLDELITDLDQWADITGPLETSLRSAYDADPMRTTRIAASVITSSQAGRLTNPAGLLTTKLRELHARNPDDIPF